MNIHVALLHPVPYLQTMARYRSLSRVHFAPEVVALIEHLTGDDAAALRRILARAVHAAEIRHWWRKGSAWVPGIAGQAAPPHVLPGALGVCPADVVGLFAQLGGPVPEVLSYLLTKAPEATTGAWWRLEFDVREMAQAEGLRLHGLGMKTRNDAIADAVAKRIAAQEKVTSANTRSPRRHCPAGSTVCKAALTGWNFTAP